LLLPQSGGAAAENTQGRLTEKEAIELALKQHPAVKESQERVAAAKSQIGISRSAYLPQANFTGNYYHGNAFSGASFGSSAAPILTGRAPGSASPLPSVSDFYVYRFNFTQLITDFGRTTGTIAVSKAGYHQSQDDYAGVRQRVVLEARTAFYGLLAARRAVQVEEENVRQNQELLRQAQGFYQVGTRAKIDVTKAEANLFDAETALIRAKNLVDLARVSLMTALGLKNWPYKTLEDVMEAPPRPLALGELKEQALKQRPEIMRNRHQQEGDQASLKVARAGYFPTVNSTAAYGWQGTGHPLPDNWWVGVGVNIPLFQGLKTKYSVDQAKAQLRATLANAEVLGQDVNKEVEQNYLDVKTAREVIRSTAKAREAAQENLRLAQGRYKAGVGSIIEVTDAQVQFSRSDLRYVQALYDYRIAEAKLDKAVGRPY
jgi:outer membrane protein TolC